MNKQEYTIIMKQNVIIPWIISPEVHYNDDVFCYKKWDNFSSTSLLLPLLRCLEIQTPRPSLPLELLPKPSLDRMNREKRWNASELQMGCLYVWNSWGIYRVECLEVKGCLQCQHSILNQMCGELVSAARRTIFVRRTKFLSSPYLPLILPFWSFFFFLWFPALWLLFISVPPSIFPLFLFLVKSFVIFNGISSFNRYGIDPFFDLTWNT